MGNAALIRNRATLLLNSLNGDLKPETKELKAAFERDMRPVAGAVVSALEAGDVEALKGLRAILPHLLKDVNRSPALADLLAHQLGKSFLEGLNAKPEATL
jgi:hypothetical protein